MKYRTKDGQDYTLPGIGRTVNGVIVTDKLIENPNFELVEETPQPPPAPQPVVPPAPQLQPVITAPVQSVPVLPSAEPAPQANQGSTI